MGPSLLVENVATHAPIGRPGELVAVPRPEGLGPKRGWIRVSAERRERMTREHRLRSSREIGEVKTAGRALRGEHCLLLVLARPGEPTKLGFIASRKSVGGAVQRNRARRRLREIVRRRWPRVAATGYWILFIAHAGSRTAEHQDLASEVERLLESAGALAPLGAAEPS